MILSQEIDTKLAAALDYANTQALSGATVGMLSAIRSDKEKMPNAPIKKKINVCTYTSLQSTINKLKLQQSLSIVNDLSKVSTEDIDHLIEQKPKVTTDNNRLKEQAHPITELNNVIKESQTQFHKIFETSRLGNSIIARNLKIIELNPAMVALLGYEKREEIIGTCILDYAAPGFRKDWKTLQTKLWEIRIPYFSLETRLRKKDGSTIWCNVTSILFQDQEKTFEYTVIEDISQPNKLRKHKEELEIFRVTSDTQEAERRRISESLHNGLSQLLFGTKMAIDNLSVKVATQDSELFDKSKAYATKLLTDAMIDVRRISHELMPTILVDFGLKAAIEAVCDQSHNGVRFDCKVALGSSKLDSYVELTVFRTVQELVLNILKHADAKNASVEVLTDNHNVVIMVQDDGRGMAASRHDKTSIGLSSLRYKVNLLKGSLDIDSELGKGTNVKVLLPVQI